jgi:hypothetical protein
LSTILFREDPPYICDDRKQVWRLISRVPFIHHTRVPLSYISIKTTTFTHKLFFTVFWRTCTKTRLF